MIIKLKGINLQASFVGIDNMPCLTTRTNQELNQNNTFLYVTNCLQY